MPLVSCPPSGVDAGVGRSIVDGTILERFTELGTGRRGEMAGRAGYGSAGEVRSELEGVIGWGSFGYF
jgi:cleavage and polyadenylation specificity factor subunit 1